ncbi:MAG: hypothetical protein QF886_02065 [Planctomycetota bacterium]|nr:hypothetical protein [Planctomycetota bacterium]
MNISALAIQMSKADIERLVKQKERNLRRVASLRAKGEQLRAEIVAINEEIISLGGEADPGSKPSVSEKPAKKRRGRPRKAAAKVSAKPAKKVKKKASKSRKRAARGGTWEERVSEALTSMGGEALQKDLVVRFFGNEFTPGQYATVASAITNSKNIEKTKEEHGVVARLSGGATTKGTSAKKKAAKSRKQKTKKSDVPLNDAAYDYLKAHGGRAAIAEVRAAVLAKGQHHLALTGKLRHDARISSEDGDYVIVA